MPLQSRRIRVSPTMQRKCNFQSSAVQAPGHPRTRGSCRLEEGIRAPPPLVSVCRKLSPIGRYSAEKTKTEMRKTLCLFTFVESAPARSGNFLVVKKPLAGENWAHVLTPVPSPDLDRSRGRHRTGCLKIFKSARKASRFGFFLLTNQE